MSENTALYVRELCNTELCLQKMVEHSTVSNTAVVQHSSVSARQLDNPAPCLPQKCTTQHCVRKHSTVWQRTVQHSPVPAENCRKQHCVYQTAVNTALYPQDNRTTQYRVCKITRQYSILIARQLCHTALYLPDIYTVSVRLYLPQNCTTQHCIF